MATSTVTIGFTGYGDTQSGAIALTTDGDNNRGPISLTSMQANKLVSNAFELADIKRMVIFSDKAVLLETNDSGTPDDTITLQANVPFFWDASGYFPNLLGDPVTAIYLTNLASSVATVSLYFPVDGTP